MHVIRRRDGDGVEVIAHLVEQLPVVAKARQVRPAQKGRAALLEVDVAQRDEVLIGAIEQVGRALAADADAGDPKFARGRDEVAETRSGRGLRAEAGDAGGERGDGGGLDKSAAVHAWGGGLRGHD